MNTTVMEKRGLTVGYIREHMLMTAREMEHARSGLVAFARNRSMELDAIFVEHLETVPDAFAAMVDKIGGVENATVIVPGAHHFWGLGNHPMVVLEALQGDGVQVLFAPHVD